MKPTTAGASCLWIQLSDQFSPRGPAAGVPPTDDGTVRDGRVYKSDLGRTIGKTGKAGKPTSWVKVVLNDDGKIVIAYPIRPPQ